MATKKTLSKYEEIMQKVETLPEAQRLDYLLGQIALIQPAVMLEDLMNASLRNAALYNAVTALLKYYKIELDPIAAAQKSHPVGALAHGLPPADYQDESYPIQ